MPRRVPSVKRPKFKQRISTPLVTNTPSWKPAKTGTGNYGKTVSAAAHTRNAARKAGVAVPAPGANGMGTRAAGASSRIPTSARPTVVPSKPTVAPKMPAVDAIKSKKRPGAPRRSSKSY